jgi:hypothetical protein
VTPSPASAGTAARSRVGQADGASRPRQREAAPARGPRSTGRPDSDGLSSGLRGGPEPHLTSCRSRTVPTRPLLFVPNGPDEPRRLRKDTSALRTQPAGATCSCTRQSQLGGGGPGRSRTDDTRFRKPLLYPSELRGHNELQIAGRRLGRRFRQPHALGHHVVVGQPCVALRRDDRSVTENLLECGERPALLEP